ncbi:MAG: SIMPL domain-containing protein [Bdellovibrionota bacterium]
MISKFTGVALCIGLALAGFFIGAGLKELRRDKESISVRGLSERLVKSNEAKLEIRYALATSTVGEFSSTVQKAQSEIIKFLKVQGFAETEIQNGEVKMTDQMAAQYGQDKKVALRYTGTGSVIVGTKNVEIAGKVKQLSSELLDKGVPLAGTSLKYFFTDLNSIKNEMLKDATSNAKTAAESFASNAGVSLGKLRSASQGSFEIAEPLGDGASYDEYGGGGQSSVNKKVRVVVSVDFATGG